MKTEKLELKHLAPYLPYGLKCTIHNLNPRFAHPQKTYRRGRNKI